MSTGGDLRDNSAIGLMRRILSDHSLGEDLPVAGNQCDRAVVTGGLKAQD